MHIIVALLERITLENSVYNNKQPNIMNIKINRETNSPIISALMMSTFLLMLCVSEKRATIELTVN